MVTWSVFAVLYTLPGYLQLSPSFGQNFVYSLAVITRQNKELNNVTEGAHFFIVFEGIIGPLLIALLALALRRKVMR